MCGYESKRASEGMQSGGEEVIIMKAGGGQVEKINQPVSRR